MTKKIATRQAFGETLAELGDKYPQIVCFDADLSKSTMSKFFAKKFPDRFFEMGIQEANMIGCAAGMSFTGKIPFICSFGAFVTGRYDQIRMSIGYSRANVKIIGTHAGVAIGEDGHSQMGLEDIALMRAIPGMVVLQPATPKETKEMIEWAVKHDGPVYLRLTRQGVADIEMDPFHPGKFPKVKQGEKIAFLSSGGLLEDVLTAAQNLEQKGFMKASVYNANCAKPLDKEFMTLLAENYKEIVVFEDHTIMGGTGSAIAEWISEFAPVPRRVRRYGVRDVFGESGTPAEILRHFGLNAERIEEYFKVLSTEQER